MARSLSQTLATAAVTLLVAVGAFASSAAAAPAAPLPAAIKAAITDGGYSDPVHIAKTAATDGDAWSSHNGDRFRLVTEITPTKPKPGTKTISLGKPPAMAKYAAYLIQFDPKTRNVMLRNAPKVIPGFPAGHKASLIGARSVGAWILVDIQAD